MDIKTIIAVGELVQAAAHQNGVTGPVEFRTLCHQDWCSVDDDYIEMDEDDDPADLLTGDLYDQL